MNIIYLKDVYASYQEETQFGDYEDQGDYYEN